MSNVYSAEDAAWRKRLESVVEHLSDRDLERHLAQVERALSGSAS